MAILLLLIGVVLIITAIRGTESQLWNLVYNDMTGAQGGASGFLIWLLAIVSIGAIGYYKPAKQASDLLLGLVILGIFISNRGFFSNLTQAFGGIASEQPVAATDPTTAALPSGIPIQQVGSSGGGILGTAQQGVSTASGLVGLFGNLF